MTRLLLLGVSHHSAPVELRERLDFSRAGLDTALATLADRHDIGEAVVLSTCNRAEVYTSCAEIDRTRDRLTRFLSDFHELPPGALTPHLYERADRAAVQHLFRVAAGLDSLVVGEPQILGQVKDAFATASSQAHTGALLNRLFHVAFTVGKRVRSETAVGKGAVSVSYAAVSLAHKIFGSLDGLNVLLLGAGEMGKLTALNLRSHHVGRIAIASRTRSRAEALAAEMAGDAVPWSSVESELATSDILISVTGSPEPILSRADLEAAMAARRYRPLFIIDIAVPRDVHPAAGQIEQVFLYNIDDLQAIVDDNMSKRRAEIARAEAIVDEEVTRFAAWLRSRGAVPTVVALRQRFERIRRAELARLQPKMASLPPDALARVDEITRLVVEKLLHTPTEQLKALPDHEAVETYADALRRLFDLPADDEEPDGRTTPADGEHRAPGTNDAARHDTSKVGT